MRLHDPEVFEAHRGRTTEHLNYIAGLAGWSLEEAIERKWQVEIEDNIPIPASTPAAPTGKKRGRPPGKKNIPAENTALLNAVDFISVVETDAFEFSKFCAIRGMAATAYSNILSAGFPVAEELNLCPHMDKLKAALNRCGRTLSISENNNQLSVKGDKLRALVPCLAEPLAAITPDMPIINGDFDILKDAFRACGTVADEAADRPMYASLLLDPNTVTATNGKVLIQYWHGIANLPPGTVIPKVFAKTIVGIRYKITGIGGTFEQSLNPTTQQMVGFMRSLTLWFENGSWIKTQCFEDRWQDFSHLLDVPTAARPVPEGFFEAVAAVEPFCEDTSAVHLGVETLMSHLNGEDGAVYECKGVQSGKIFNAKLIRQVEPYVTTLDLTTQPDRAFFFGGTIANPIRGVFMGMIGSQ